MSFYDWCIENDHLNLLDMWENGNNDLAPNEVTYRSDKKIKFSCGNPDHPVKIIRVASVTDPNRTGLTTNRFCLGCHSVGQFIVDHYGKDYLYKIWSDKNDISPFEVATNSKSKRIWLRCLNNKEHDDYDLTAGNIVNAFGCPYCRNRRIYKGNNLALLYPEVSEYWSDINTLSPDKYIASSHEEAWFTCPVEYHKDYKREIRFAIEENFICPICLRIESSRKGANHPYYKGTLDKNKRIRVHSDYKQWRLRVFERDNYTCQCCGQRGGRLNAHHIRCFSKYPDLRLVISNGITLCERCHDIKYDGSLHNWYGIDNVTPEELEQYINIKRHLLGNLDIFSLDNFIALSK